MCLTALLLHDVTVCGRAIHHVSMARAAVVNRVRGRPTIPVFILNPMHEQKRKFVPGGRMDDICGQCTAKAFVQNVTEGKNLPRVEVESKAMTEKKSSAVTMRTTVSTIVLSMRPQVFCLSWPQAKHRIDFAKNCIRFLADLCPQLPRVRWLCPAWAERCRHRVSMEREEHSHQHSEKRRSAGPE